MLSRFRSLAAVQIGMVVLVLGVLLVAPPAFGTMVIVPLGSQAESAPRFASDHGLTILKQGPVRGSFVVFGKGDRLVGPGLREGLLVLQAPDMLCGEAPRDPA